jgi:hypothetical protein
MDSGSRSGTEQESGLHFIEGSATRVPALQPYVVVPPAYSNPSEHSTKHCSYGPSIWPGVQLTIIAERAIPYPRVSAVSPRFFGTSHFWSGMHLMVAWENSE